MTREGVRFYEPEDRKFRSPGRSYPFPRPRARLREDLACFARFFDGPSGVPEEEK